MHLLHSGQVSPSKTLGWEPLHVPCMFLGSPAAATHGSSCSLTSGSSATTSMTTVLVVPLLCLSVCLSSLWCRVALLLLHTVDSQWHSFDALTPVSVVKCVCCGNDTKIQEHSESNFDRAQCCTVNDEFVMVVQCSHSK